MGDLADKIKQEHNILDEFHSLLNKVAQIKQIQRIIPGRISRKQSGTSKEHFTISYPTKSGFKCLIKKGSTAQEIFITCSTETKPVVKKQLQHLTN